MQHVKRSHPDVGSVENEPEAPREASPQESVKESVEQSGDGSAYENESSSLEFSGNAWLTMKLKRLEERKRAEIARFDSEIAAIKKILAS